MEPKLSAEARRNRMRKIVARIQGYVATYTDQAAYADYSDDTFVNDMLYGIGMAISDEYRHAGGFRRFKERIARELSASAPANAPAATPAGEVVVTTNKAGQCVCVSRQDEDGRILSVIWEAPASSSQEQATGYVQFHEGGVRVDIDRYFKGPEGRAALKRHGRTSDAAKQVMGNLRAENNYLRNEIEAATGDAVRHGSTCDSPEEIEDCDALRMRMADLLTRTANALKGEPMPLCMHSWHDLPEVAAVFNSPNKGHVYYHAGDPDCPKSIKAPNGEVHTLMCRLCALKQSEAKNTYCAGAVAKALSADKASGEVGR